MESLAQQIMIQKLKRNLCRTIAVLGIAAVAAGAVMLRMNMVADSTQIAGQLVGIGGWAAIIVYFVGRPTKKELEWLYTLKEREEREEQFRRQEEQRKEAAKTANQRRTQKTYVQPVYAQPVQPYYSPIEAVSDEEEEEERRREEERQQAIEEEEEEYRRREEEEWYYWYVQVPEEEARAREEAECYGEDWENDG